MKMKMRKFVKVSQFQKYKGYGHLHTREAKGRKNLSRIPPNRKQPGSAWAERLKALPSYGVQFLQLPLVTNIGTVSRLNTLADPS